MTALPSLPTSNVLLGGRTLLLLPTLVGMVGLNEAIVLQQVRYRLGDDLRPLVRDGKRWARDPLERWRERDFPFWEIDTVRRAFQSLEARGLLQAAQFDKHLRDRTKSYTINFEALAARERDYRAARAGNTPPGRAVTGVRRKGPREGGDPVGGETLPPLPANDLLIDEPPLIIVVNLATTIGLDEALILQQIRYWLADERRPHVRDGRRWVCPREVGLLTPLAFRSAKTLARALRALEGRGLILSSERYNRLPGDRTKWYSVDFARVAMLATTPEGQNAGIEMDEMPVSSEPNYQTQSGQNATIVRPILPCSTGTEGGAQEANLPGSLRGSETDRQNKRIQQQQGNAAVVAASSQHALLQEQLIARGITAATARTLARDHAARIAEQVDIFDWLRDGDRDDPRLTAGRLRRMIEEEWADPPGYVPRREREAQAAEASERRQRVEQGRAAAAIAQQERADAERVRWLTLLEQLGLREDDQRVWSNVIAATADVPRFLREALFYPPSRESPIAAIILPDAADAARARTLPAATRQRLVRRIADRAKLPTVELWMCDQAEVRALLNTPERALSC